MLKGGRKTIKLSIYFLPSIAFSMDNHEISRLGWWHLEEVNYGLFEVLLHGPEELLTKTPINSLFEFKGEIIF
jgi:hypothetical protein